MSLSIPLAEAELEMVRKIKVEKYFLLPILLLSQFFVCLDSFFVSIFFFLIFLSQFFFCLNFLYQFSLDFRELQMQRCTLLVIGLLASFAACE